MTSSKQKGKDYMQKEGKKARNRDKVSLNINYMQEELADLRREIAGNHYVSVGCLLYILAILTKDTSFALISLFLIAAGVVFYLINFLKCRK